ncbi:MAG TPA: hypothetical protein PLY31_02740 [Tenuifilaceae bacterium]|nr:hypothetical protein [Tenuifilaceae bacterium]HPW26030.1 hypothetical protein [Tenuifilaceae bacterium]
MSNRTGAHSAYQKSILFILAFVILLPLFGCSNRTVVQKSGKAKYTKKYKCKCSKPKANRQTYKYLK